MRLFLLLLPTAFASVYLVPEQVAGPTVLVSLFVIAICAVLTVKTFWTSFTVPMGPWPIFLLAALFSANAILMGNEYGRTKILLWVGSCLPLIVWPVWARMTSRDFLALAWGQLLAGLLLLPTVVTLDPVWWGDGTYIGTSIFAGLAVAAGLFIPKMHPKTLFKPLLMIPCVVLTLIALAGLLVSGSRGAIIGLAVAMLAVPIIYGFRSVAIIGVMVLLACLVALAVPDVRDWIEGFLAERFAEETVESQFAVRVLLGQIALDAFMAHPLFGLGAGNFQDLSVIGFVEHKYPHNLFFELAAEFGIFGVLLMLYSLLAATKSFWKLRLQDRAAASFGMVCLIFLSVNAMKMGDLSMHRSLYLWIGIAFAVRQTRPSYFLKLLSPAK